MMTFAIVFGTVGAWLVLMLTPWRRVADQGIRWGTRVRALRPVRRDQTREQKSAYIPRHREQRV